MAIKKRKKIKNKNAKVEKSSAPPASDENKTGEVSEKKAVKEVKEKPKKETPVKSEPKKGSSMKPKETKNEGTGIAGYIQFLKEVRIEYKKINWPDRRQIVQETWTVIILVTFITLLVLAYDWVLGNIVFGPLEHWIKINL